MSKEMLQQSEVNMLISLFNAKKGTCYKFSAQKNLDGIKRACEVLNYDFPTLKKAINDFAGNDFDVFIKQLPILSEFGTPTPAPAPATPTPITPIQPTNLSDAQQTAQNSLSLLEQAMAQIFIQQKGDELAKGVLENVEKQVTEFIYKTYGPIQRKIEIQFGEKKAQLEGVLHDKFDEVLAFVSANEPVFLCGPAGSGKNVLCQQIAQTLELDFYFSNAVTQEYKITGFTDAMGIFHESQFYKAFKNGGVFMLDEMDASIPEVLIILNAAIANRYFDFPAPIGYVEAHKDFRVISAGNTFGHGASYQYVGRNQLDMASLDRFAVVEISYSEEIEKSCAQGDEELTQFIRQFRQASEKSGINTITSYRAITRISKMVPALGIQKTLKTCLTKSLERDDLKMIISNINCNNKYGQALRKLSEVHN